MSRKITNVCESCGACESECPNGAISQGEDHFVIDPALCDECAAAGGDSRCVSVCPTEGAIVQA
jgi:ferredoxin